MADDTLYLNPHEAALAVIATSMKKARLRLDILFLNSITGGLLFVPGGLLFIALHSECLEILHTNPGVLTFIGAANFTIGLFFVLINGAELFNSNILYFSLGLIRNSVTIFDLVISWIVSLIGNLGGCLFATYLFVYVSTTGTSKDWVEGSIYLLNEKNSFNFIRTFIKAIAGNWFVCLAVYLQLMVKPTHVKLIVMGLPIFTFVSLGFTHVIADMPILFLGMLNGGHLSVGKYIWRLLIPAVLGNIVGGVAFTILVPYYLHLLVVEFDRKKLNLPNYEERDEQPDVNMDSRVVRVLPSSIRKSTIKNMHISPLRSNKKLHRVKVHPSDDYEKVSLKDEGDDSDSTESTMSVESHRADDGTLSIVSSPASLSTFSSRSSTNTNTSTNKVQTLQHMVVDPNSSNNDKFVTNNNGTDVRSRLKVEHSNGTAILPIALTPTNIESASIINTVPHTIDTTLSNTISNTHSIYSKKGDHINRISATSTSKPHQRSGSRSSKSSNRSNHATQIHSNTNTNTDTIIWRTKSQNLIKRIKTINKTPPGVFPILGMDSDEIEYVAENEYSSDNSNDNGNKQENIMDPDRQLIHDIFSSHTTTKSDVDGTFNSEPYLSSSNFYTTDSHKSRHSRTHSSTTHEFNKERSPSMSQYSVKSYSGRNSVHSYSQNIFNENAEDSKSMSRDKASTNKVSDKNHYNVLEDKPGARLEKTLSKLIERTASRARSRSCSHSTIQNQDQTEYSYDIERNAPDSTANNNKRLSKTTQDLLPTNALDKPGSYD
ncbi:hypothetical protein TBLA_0G02300 [Henningerozyma blattae CBS 6284]|uniref:Formate/nitrite transporter n=1 Tax=Henningerozyma blattae (strain ATCC 34711 / CBS 6284 / DSM 70876 / NBRC 10599 / NRRL Y-10934 / UCD 77-7) TaxID=1071380 RepID=I2H718_HENB6|nr:hypothetical protein TBLA_0G02300 [Tetrapisispora blattae CBS 6284]CCH62170.1 hypothetical protein TBLA_0G02300 [Tetrapisispora blattae CBS 6284]